MDLSQIKNKLNAIQSNPKGGGDKKPNVFWKPTVGKQTIRVIPSKFDKANPFKEVYLNYALGKTILSLTNFGEKCPIDEFVKVLRKSGDKDNWKLSKKLENKMRVLIPVIERGKEAEGVKFWNVGKETYMDFLNLADNEDVGDFTDIVEGRDITVTTVGKDVTGTDYNKSSIMPRTKQTPLSDDKAIVKSLLNDQPDPLESFKKYEFAEVKQFLFDFLNPEEETKTETEEEDMVITKTATKPAKTTTSKTDKFDDLFDK